MSRHVALSIIASGVVSIACAKYVAADDNNSDSGTSEGQKSTSDEPIEANGGKYLLRYRFHKGETVRSKVVQQTKIETTIGGTTQAAEMTSISIKAWRVTNVEDDGRVTFDTMIEAVDMRQQMSGRQEVRYNSQTDSKPPAGYESAAASVGKLLTTITIDPVGKLLRREKKNQVGVDNLNALVVVPLPEGEISVGEPWSVPLEVSISLDRGETKTLTVKNRYQLEKVENGTATISVQTVLPPVNDPRIRAQLVQRMAKGTIRFDINAGRVVSQHTDLDEQVIGFNGPNSSLQYVGRFTEELVGDEAQAAANTALKR